MWISRRLQEHPSKERIMKSSATSFVRCAVGCGCYLFGCACGLLVSLMLLEAMLALLPPLRKRKHGVTLTEGPDDPVASSIGEPCSEWRVSQRQDRPLFTLSAALMHLGLGTVSQSGFHSMHTNRKRRKNSLMKAWELACQRSCSPSLARFLHGQTHTARKRVL
eukprot:277535-Amphidinium_carterae.1